MQLSRQRQSGRKIIQGLLVFTMVACIIILTVLFVLNSSYLNWDFANLETALAGTMLHGFEWVFVRICPFIIVLSAVVLFCIRRRDV